MTSPSHSFIFTRSNTRVCREPQLVFRGPVWAMRPTAAQKDKENVEGEADGDAPRAPPAAPAGARQVTEFFGRAAESGAAAETNAAP